VIDMEVVTGEGKKVTCSAGNNADLFNAVRAGRRPRLSAGRGKALQRRPARRQRPARWPVRRPGPAQPTTIEYFDYLNRFAAFEAALRANGQWFFPHPWLMTFIGDSQIESVVNTELDALNPAMDLGPFGQVALVPIRRSAISSPLLRMPADDLCFAFNLVRIPATSDASEANRLVDANKATYERVKAVGGRFPGHATKGWQDC
jgi:hypothetical protein